MRSVLSPLIVDDDAAAVFAHRFQVQAADDRASPLVTHVMVRPADRGETVVHRCGRTADRRIGARDRRVPMMVHHIVVNGGAVTVGRSSQTKITTKVRRVRAHTHG